MLGPEAAIRVRPLPLLLLVLTALAPEASALSPRNASYAIEARLDTAERSIEGREVVTWRNAQQRPAEELRFHLYWNAWRNDRSSWMLDSGRRSDVERPRREDWSFMDVSSARLLAPEGPIDLTPGLRFDAPDDGNPHDRTVLVVPLPAAVAPGATIEVELAWRARVPRTFARTGVRGDFYFVAHWFPAIGVFEAEGWNCHQFHASTEFYSDFGVYDVAVTVPQRFVFGATGRLVERRENPDGTVTWRHRQEDVHTFTWTASPDYEVVERRFEAEGLPPIDMRLLFQPEHRDQVERHLRAASAAFEHYGRWYGPYPYGHVTIVDPAYGSGAGGMEYPTLFTCGTRLFNPFGGDSPESVTIHEAGHQFWYGIVGNNEFEHAWIDEGLNTFSTWRTLDAAYPPRRLVRRYLPLPGERGRSAGVFARLVPGITVPRFVRHLDDYRRAAESDDPATPSFRYLAQTGADITYDKTALWLATLERHLGWATLQRILSTFFERHAFGHPRPEDFFAVAEEVAGTDLGWFFDQVFRGSERFDYAIDSVESVPAEPEGFVDGEGGAVWRERGKEDDATVYRTRVIARRLGGGRFPVEIALAFEDGSEHRERWDGQARSKTIVVERGSKLRWAAVDPDHVLMLDVDLTNNSRRREPDAHFAAAKWASIWTLWLQDRLAAMSFFP